MLAAFHQGRPGGALDQPRTDILGQLRTKDFLEGLLDVFLCRVGKSINSHGKVAFVAQRKFPAAPRFERGVERERQALPFAKGLLGRGGTVDADDDFAGIKTAAHDVPFLDARAFTEAASSWLQEKARLISPSNSGPSVPLT